MPEKGGVLAAIGERHRLLVPKSSPHRILGHYRSVVYYFTFIGVANSHFTRKCYTNLKIQLLSIGVNPSLMSQMDAIFMLFYAIGSFFSGNLGDRTHAPSIVGIGLIGSGISIMLLAIGFWDEMRQNLTPTLDHAIFLVLWMFHGIMQSTGGPNSTAIMGNWFGAKNRVYIFGTWTCHQHIGNAMAALVAAIVLHYSTVPWQWALLIPSISNIIWGVVCITVLPETPEAVGLELPESDRIPIASRRAETTNVDAAIVAPPLTIIESFQLPNVIGYSLAFGLFKFINYTIYFWLPFYLSQRWSSVEGNLMSILFDVGMIPAGLLVGVASDLYDGRRACVIATFMLLLTIVFLAFTFFAELLSAGGMLALLGLMGCLVGGPNNIITSAVAIDLSGHPAIRGNARALGSVTGLINGTGSVIASLGLLGVGPLQVAHGWRAVWLMLAVFSVTGTLLLGPQLRREIAPLTAESSAAGAPSRRGGYEKV
jgi:OPA family glycerol-3-phosphate transporter-like MFS transporter 1/2